VHARLVDGPRTVTGRVQRLHQSHGHEPIVRLLRSYAPPLLRGGFPVAVCGGFLRQTFECLDDASPQAFALAVDSMLELCGARQVKAIEQRPCVEANRSLEITRRKCNLELDDVA
jgi:hypothetical protein